MNFTANHLPYQTTGYFTKLVTDYLSQALPLQPFYTHTPNINGLQQAIAAREQVVGYKEVLTDALQRQYATIQTSEAVKQNIALLKLKNTFTITTAHQPVIFTGTLYFIYKILHTIKLANECKQQLPQYNFVPIFYVGSEDADLEELGKIYLGNEKIVWDTKQTGAVGRMNTKGLEKIIDRIAGELSVQTFGNELVQLLKDCYLNSPNIQIATFKLINALFANYGLVVLIPDDAALKRVMINVFEDDLLHQTASNIVGDTIELLAKQYKVQANPRAINLFYLKDDKRERIDVKEGKYEIVNSNIIFTKEEIIKELTNHPERFSPNVILRGLFQETILPNIAFVGGGGELAYWLELKNMFTHYKVPYPVLILRNSFTIIEKKWATKVDRLGFTVKDFFKQEQDLLADIAMRNKKVQLQLTTELQKINSIYDDLKNKAISVDATLEQHVEALKARAVKPLLQLEKKMLRAEKRKYETEFQQIKTIKAALFPVNNLQERIENFMPYYAKWGADFITLLYNYSLSFQQAFMIIEENKS